MPRIEPTLVPIVADVERGLRYLGVPRHTTGGLLDVLPYSESIAPNDRLELQDGFVFNMAGFRHVVPNAVPTTIDGGLTLPLAPLPLYAVLKLVAFSEQNSRV